MKKILLLVLTGMSWLSYAQEVVVPEPGNAGRDEVLQCVEWLQKTPVEESREARKLANAFLLQWISSSPAVHVELRKDIVDMATTNPDLLAIYISGWVKYSLENNQGYPSVEAHISGIRAAIKFYEENRSGLNRDRFIEKLIKQEKKGTMEKVLRKDWG